jgi:addiction module HigA family antidote
MKNSSSFILEKQVRPVHPGEVIADLLEDLEMTTIDFAQKLDVAPDTVEAIIQGRLPVKVDMAIRLGKALGNGPQLWLNLQQKVDIWDTMQEKAADYRKVMLVR